MIPCGISDIAAVGGSDIASVPDAAILIPYGISDIAAVGGSDIVSFGDNEIRFTNRESVL